MKIALKLIFTKPNKNPVLAYSSLLKAIFVVGFIIAIAIPFAVSKEIEAQDSKTISVTIIDNGLEIEIETTEKKVENLLSEANITLNHGDLVFPDLSSEIDQNYKIFIYRSTKGTTKEIEEPENSIITYTIQPGDTVSSIAKRFDISWNTIKWANNLESYDQVLLGQTLLILPINGVLHTVQEGETLNEITLKYQGGQEKIIEYNQILDPENLTPGEKIIIPDGRLPEPPKPKIVPKETKTEKVVPPKTKTKTEPKPDPKAPAKTKTKESQSEKSLVGMASWYDWKSGLGCASLKFPLGTRLKVTNIKTGASVEVVVNDRGPYNSRIIDLNREAFSRIAPLGSGVVKARVEQIK